MAAAAGPSHVAAEAAAAEAAAGEETPAEPTEQEKEVASAYSKLSKKEIGI